LATELRWILLGLSAFLLAGIWWWGVRRSRQSPDAQPAYESAASSAEPPPQYRAEQAESRDWGVPPLEPLSIRTADFDRDHLIDLPMTATAEPLDVTLDMHYVEHEISAAPAIALPQTGGASMTEPLSLESSVSGPSIPEPVRSNPTNSTPNAGETQKIVTVRVCATGDVPWPGTDLLAALERHGLGYGRYKVFHRKHADGRTLFCAASLVEPGTFDLTRMPEEEFRGLTLFAVLPGPGDALDTVDTLIGTAMDLADTLQGGVQDSSGAPLSAQRAAALREDVARFQTSLS